MAGRLRHEIRQKKPFSSVQEEATLALMRTADLVALPVAEVLRDAKLSPSQYNVLRILRGSAGQGLSCGEISERMIRRDPDLTRLLDRLEARGLVTRARGAADRRVVLSAITEEGLALLAEIDEPMEARVRERLAHVPVSRLRDLIGLLEEVRAEKE
ncbi:MAG: MarR family transcriptional regulator [Acidobacteria bacterium]|nr:MarR family transcriptional regulator [Acidobacteriota bacterium]